MRQESSRAEQASGRARPREGALIRPPPRERTAGGARDRAGPADSDRGRRAVACGVRRGCALCCSRTDCCFFSTASASPWNLPAPDLPARAYVLIETQSGAELAAHNAGETDAVALGVSRDVCLTAPRLCRQTGWRRWHAAKRLAASRSRAMASRWLGCRSWPCNRASERPCKTHRRPAAPVVPGTGQGSHRPRDAITWYRLDSRSVLN